MPLQHTKELWLYKAHIKIGNFEYTQTNSLNNRELANNNKTSIQILFPAREYWYMPVQTLLGAVSMCTENMASVQVTSQIAGSTPWTWCLECQQLLVWMGRLMSFSIRCHWANGFSLYCPEKTKNSIITTKMQETYSTTFLTNKKLILQLKALWNTCRWSAIVHFILFSHI